MFSYHFLQQDGYSGAERNAKSFGLLVSAHCVYHVSEYKQRISLV